MGWTKETIKGVETVVGDIGDPLALHVVAVFASDPTADPPVVPPDFRGHTWLAQIREHVTSDTVVATLALEADNTTADTVDLLFSLADTTVLTGGKCYVLGAKAVTGTYASWTVIGTLHLKGRNVVARAVTP